MGTSGIFGEVARLLEAGEPMVVATVVSTRGSTPQKGGSRLLVRKDGSTLGTLGGGCVEGDVWAAAMASLREGRGPEVKLYRLDEPASSPHGMICGGLMEVLLDPVHSARDILSQVREIIGALEAGSAVALALPTRPAVAGRRLLIREDRTTIGDLGDRTLEARAVKLALDLLEHGGAGVAALEDGRECFVEAFSSPPALIMVGGGHIGKALEPLAKRLGYRFRVLDDRPKYANRDRFVEADEVLVADFAEGLRGMPIGAGASIVVATRGHHYDDVALEAALGTPARYVGLVGSRRKWFLIADGLVARGVPRDRVAAVHAPIGLDIGARTPEEIALSVMAEVVAVRRGASGGPLRTEPPAASSIEPRRERSV